MDAILAQAERGTDGQQELYIKHIEQLERQMREREEFFNRQLEDSRSYHQTQLDVSALQATVVENTKNEQQQVLESQLEVAQKNAEVARYHLAAMSQESDARMQVMQ